MKWTWMVVAWSLAATSALAEPIAVTIKPLGELTIGQETRVPAKVVAANRSTIAAEVNGVIGDIQADVGSNVVKGARLLSIDDDDLKLALQTAEAALAAGRARVDQAQARLDRAAELSGSNYVSADDLLSRQTELAIAQADIRSAEVARSIAARNLRRSQINAPFAGTVTERHAQVGAYVMPGTPLFVLVELDGREVDARVPVANTVGLGDNAAVEFSADGMRWPVAVTRISPIVDETTSTRQVRLLFAGDRAADIGITGELIWRSGSAMIPVEFVARRDGKLGVFVAVDGMAQFIELPAAQEGRPAPTNLASSASLIVDGRARLQPGDPIKIVIE